MCFGSAFFHFNWIKNNWMNKKKIRICRKFGEINDFFSFVLIFSRKSYVCYVEIVVCIFVQDEIISSEIFSNGKCMRFSFLQQRQKYINRVISILSDERTLYIFRLNHFAMQYWLKHLNIDFSAEIEIFERLFTSHSLPLKYCCHRASFNLVWQPMRL